MYISRFRIGVVLAGAVVGMGILLLFSGFDAMKQPQGIVQQQQQQQALTTTTTSDHHPHTHIRSHPLKMKQARAPPYSHVSTESERQLSTSLEIFVNETIVFNTSSSRIADATPPATQLFTMDRLEPGNPSQTIFVSRFLLPQGQGPGQHVRCQLACLTGFQNNDLLGINEGKIPTRFMVAASCPVEIEWDVMQSDDIYVIASSYEFYGLTEAQITCQTDQALHKDTDLTIGEPSEPFALSQLDYTDDTNQVFQLKVPDPWQDIYVFDKKRDLECTLQCDDASTSHILGIAFSRLPASIYDSNTYLVGGCPLTVQVRLQTESTIFFFFSSESGLQTANITCQEYTDAPTPFPSPFPTPFPTPEPTQFPTLAPTPLPTPLPTPEPTPLPTLFPTPNPTEFPTPKPTPLPTTPQPTPGPVAPVGAPVGQLPTPPANEFPETAKEGGNGEQQQQQQQFPDDFWGGRK